MIFSRMVLVFTYEGYRYRTIHRSMSSSMRYSLVLLKNLKLHLFFKHTNERYQYINTIFLNRIGTIISNQSKRYVRSKRPRTVSYGPFTCTNVSGKICTYRTYIYNLFILFWNRKIWNYTIGVMNNGTVENTYGPFSLNCIHFFPNFTSATTSRLVLNLF